MTNPHPLDPDEVPCRRPTCKAAPGKPCRQPDGSRADAIHVIRRRDAAAGGKVEPSTVDGKRRPPNNPNGPPADARSRGGKATAQARRRRKAEIAARVEQARADAENEAIRNQAAAIAADATRFARDRALLTRKALDAADLAADRLIESLKGLMRGDVDDNGRPATRPVERWDEKQARVRTIEEPDVKGWASAETVERLAKVAASTLQSLRLEEGKPTGITADAGSAAEVLGEAGVDDLLRWADQNLRR